MNCLACGECCKKLTIKLDHKEGGLAELFKIHYGKDTTNMQIVLHHRCIHLDKYNRCDIYDSPERPEICRTWYCRAAQGEEPHAIHVDVNDG